MFSDIFPLSSQENPINLDGYSLILSHSENDNQLDIIYELKLYQSNTVIPAGDEIVGLNLQFSNFDYEAVFGYMGQHNIEVISNTITTSYTDKIVDGSFHFEDPKLKIKFENSYGLPIGLAFTDLTAYFKNLGSDMIRGDSIPTTENIRVLITRI